MDTLSNGQGRGGDRVRVVGYARESPGVEDALPAFAQQEEIRRWASANGHHLVAVCQDSRQEGHALRRDGYVALLGTIAAGSVDAVVVAGIEALAADQIVQEILLWDLRSRGVGVVSTRPEDGTVTGEGDPGPTRMLIRDVLARVAEHAGVIENRPPSRPAGGADVVVRLLKDDPEDRSTAAGM
jgi:DNA invertase Pin-like site-specific DNA recombinase